MAPDVRGPEVAVEDGIGGGNARGDGKAELPARGREDNPAVIASFRAPALLAAHGSEMGRYDNITLKNRASIKHQSIRRKVCNLNYSGSECFR